MSKILGVTVFKSTDFFVFFSVSAKGPAAFRAPRSLPCACASWRFAIAHRTVFDPSFGNFSFPRSSLLRVFASQLSLGSARGDTDSSRGAAILCKFPNPGVLLSWNPRVPIVGSRLRYGSGSPREPSKVAVLHSRIIAITFGLFNFCNSLLGCVATHQLRCQQLWAGSRVWRCRLLFDETAVGMRDD